MMLLLRRLRLHDDDGDDDGDDDDDVNVNQTSLEWNVDDPKRSKDGSAQKCSKLGTSGRKMSFSSIPI